VNQLLLRNLFKQIWPFAVIIFLVILAGGVLTAAAAGTQVATPQPPEAEVPQGTYILAASDATASPTPFQPLAPTATLLAIHALEQITLTPQITPVPTETPLALNTPAPPPQVGLTEEPSLEELPDQINVLLLGSDRRPWDAGFRTDTIILVTVNSDLRRVNITSFPRDLWVMLPGWGNSRINTAWTYGGYKMLHETFKHNFGVNVDYYALIDFSTFKKMIDQMGGLDVNVGEAVSDYRAGHWVNIKPGLQKMDADKVLWYARSRKTTSDIARNRRQQEVLQALFDKLISIDALRRAPEFYDMYDNSVKTDIELVDVLRWLPFVA
jgi:LCP family protein required for cell wall assembly